MRKYRFISGLPRSGSTLLCNILAQNPRFHTTATSGILDVMFGVRNNWNQLIEFQAAPDEEAKKRVLKGMLESYYSNIDKDVVFDKSRGWVAYLEMAEELIGDVKVIVPVRDVRDVLASFEKLHRKNGLVQSHDERNAYFDSQTTRGRANILLRADQPVGLALNRIHDAVQRGHGNKMLFVPFVDLTTFPEETMQQIYKFLDEPYFEHNFDNVEQVTWENDEVHGIKGLHDIRQKVAPIKSDWQQVLGEWATDLGKLNFWRK